MTDSKPIDVLYQRLARSAPGFRHRPSQVGLSAQIQDALDTRGVCLVEAPTGTGKTLAYLIGALSSAFYKEGGRLVVATATKVLQGQLIAKDIPALRAAGILTDADTVAIAKGMGNFVCRLQVENALRTEPEESGRRNAAQAVLDELTANSWAGDLQECSSRIFQDASKFKVEAGACLKKTCQYAHFCEYLEAKKRVERARIVVANHALLLIDLESSISIAGSRQTLPFGDAEYALVADEGHHLPAAALDHATKKFSFATFRADTGALRQVNRRLDELAKLTKSPQKLSLLSLDTINSAFTCFHQDFQNWAFALSADIRNQGYLRFKRGALPPFIAESASVLGAECDAMLGCVAELSVRIRQMAEDPSLPNGFKVLFQGLGALCAKSESILLAHSEALSRFTDRERPRLARWVEFTDDDARLVSSPIRGSQVLTPLLWQNNRCSAVAIVSATLQTVGGMKPFLDETGCPESAKVAVAPPVFDYTKSSLVVPYMRHIPKGPDRYAFEQELIQKFLKFVALKEGTLVIASSWALLKRLAAHACEHLGPDRVLVQGEQAIGQLLTTHCQRIDAGRPSVLMGVASVAEGLDLPGKYCTRVLITSLPFAVPTSPLEEELQEMLGQSGYFTQRSLPQATLKLIQSTGRLLRRESDTGEVVVFDRRLVQTEYGAKMRGCLPPFKLVVHSSEDKSINLN